MLKYRKTWTTFSLIFVLPYFMFNSSHFYINMHQPEYEFIHVPHEIISYQNQQQRRVGPKYSCVVRDSSRHQLLHRWCLWLLNRWFVLTMRRPLHPQRVWGNLYVTVIWSGQYYTGFSVQCVYIDLKALNTSRGCPILPCCLFIMLDIRIHPQRIFLRVKIFHLSDWNNKLFH